MENLLRNDEQEPLFPAGTEETTKEESHGSADNMHLPSDPYVVVTKREYVDDPVEPLMPIDFNPNK